MLFMELVGRTKITRLSSRKGVYYPMVRLPLGYRDVIGKYAKIYVVDSSHFLIEIENEENPKSGFKTKKHKNGSDPSHSDVSSRAAKTRTRREAGQEGFEPPTTGLRVPRST